MEEQAIDEISKILHEFSDPNSKTFQTGYSGILKVETKLNLLELVEKIRDNIENEPWELRYCSRIIPIQKTCKTDLNSIKQNVIELKDTIQKNDSYRITIEKRNTDISTTEKITEIA